MNERITACAQNEVMRVSTGWLDALFAELQRIDRDSLQLLWIGKRLRRLVIVVPGSLSPGFEFSDHTLLCDDRLLMPSECRFGHTALDDLKDSLVLLLQRVPILGVSLRDDATAFSNVRLEPVQLLAKNRRAQFLERYDVVALLHLAHEIR